MGKILPIDGAIGITEEEFQEGLAQLRAKMLMDARGVWNKLVGLAGYAMDERVQLEAARTVMAYTLGLPTEKVEVNTLGGGTKSVRKAPPLEVISDEEVAALKVLRDAQRRRALTNGSDDDK